MLIMVSEDTLRKSLLMNTCGNACITESTLVSLLRLKLFVDNEIKDYRGSRDIKSLMDFVTSNTNSEKVQADVCQVFKCTI